MGLCPTGNENEEGGIVGMGECVESNEDLVLIPCVIVAFVQTVNYENNLAVNRCGLLDRLERECNELLELLVDRSIADKRVLCQIIGDFFDQL